MGGTYSGNGVNNGIFYPDSAGIGNYIITYTGELNGCFVSDSQTITVNPLPILSVGSVPELCVNDSLILNLLSPSGGNYSGNNINNGIFYSNNTNIGINNINYTYTDINSCSNNQNISLIVNDLTNIYSSNSLINDFCVNDSISSSNLYYDNGVVMARGKFISKLKVSTTSLMGAGISTKYIIADKANKIAKKDKII